MIRDLQVARVCDQGEGHVGVEVEVLEKTEDHQAAPSAQHAEMPHDRDLRRGQQVLRGLPRLTLRVQVMGKRQAYEDERHVAVAHFACRPQHLREPLQADAERREDPDDDGMVPELLQHPRDDGGGVEGLVGVVLLGVLTRQLAGSRRCDHGDASHRRHRRRKVGRRLSSPLRLLRRHLGSKRARGSQAVHIAFRNAAGQVGASFRALA
mmetsp:Transcript_26818/g.68135  ORF Transcript_26818/g.68135 Transcript_26818/m.68135 type:complete len:209 (-) Transcript_26818:1-627(-)